MKWAIGPPARCSVWAAILYIDATLAGMEITPAQDDPPTPRALLPYDVAAQAHAIHMATELLATDRERIRAEGAGEDAPVRAVAELERIEQHLAWALDRLGQVVEMLQAAGWRPPPGRRSEHVDRWGPPPSI